ncbi:hypothetical protein BS47DRAFT_1360745 [Hydnum rufescens UP504]|uniref:Uncharacterized protein n=1 Tax=Hydnum rufescens UP504 TaxID=1448309 RepID=A0A9P6B1I2_9AGAM|nr:hypothetical protein BS47DRAFT_1360745 [Hydnum rufescens UP504]
MLIVDILKVAHAWAHQRCQRTVVMARGRGLEWVMMMVEEKGESGLYEGNDDDQNADDHSKDDKNPMTEFWGIAMVKQQESKCRFRFQELVFVQEVVRVHKRIGVQRKGRHSSNEIPLVINQLLTCGHGTCGV